MKQVAMLCVMVGIVALFVGTAQAQTSYNYRLVPYQITIVQTSLEDLDGRVNAKLGTVEQCYVLGPPVVVYPPEGDLFAVRLYMQSLICQRLHTMDYQGDGQAEHLSAMNPPAMTLPARQPMSGKK